MNKIFINSQSESRSVPHRYVGILASYEEFNKLFCFIHIHKKCKIYANAIQTETRENFGSFWYCKQFFSDLPLLISRRIWGAGCSVIFCLVNFTVETPKRWRWGGRWEGGFICLAIINESCLDLILWVVSSYAAVTSILSPQNITIYTLK